MRGVVRGSCIPIALLILVAGWAVPVRAHAMHIAEGILPAERSFT